MTNLIAAFCASLVICAISGLFFIPFLRRVKAGQSIREIGPSWHKAKQGTPTMGGLMFFLSTAIVVAGFKLIGWTEDFSALFVLLFACVFGAVGFYDDYIKVVKKRNLGLKALPKLILQLTAAAAFLAVLRYFGMTTTDVYIPFVGATIPVGWLIYLTCALIYIAGFVNAVNLTDGIDGVASGVTLPICVFFAAVAYGADGQNAYGVFAAALAGGLVGFLIYNYNPAKIFMGDTGSLFLGGAVCGLAFVCDMPLILIPVGLIYLAEMFSVIIQVGYFKLSHGKRIFRMAPYHHHLEMGGWKEKCIFWTFSAITAALCALSYWSLTW